MHILFISEYFPPAVQGGGEINLAALCQALTEVGIKVTVLTSFCKGMPEKEEKFMVTILRRLKTGRDPGSLRSNLVRKISYFPSVQHEAVRITHEENIDLIHLIGISVGAAERLQKMKKPLVATVESYPALCPKGDRIYHGKKECAITCSYTAFRRCQQDSPEIGKMPNKIYLKHNPLFHYTLYNHYQQLQNSLRHCSVIAISRYVQELLHLHGISSTVVPNIIDADFFASPPASAPAGNRNAQPTILYVGSLTRYKGAHILLEALQGSAYRCLFYGDGLLLKELQQRIQEMGLDATILPPVPYTQIPSVYAQADLVVFPSLWPEPFGRIPLEALAAGIPVVSSNIGGIKETVQKWHGKLVPPGDAKALRTAIDTVLSDASYAAAAREKGNQSVKQGYGKEAVAQKMLREYSDIISQHTA